MNQDEAAHSAAGFSPFFFMKLASHLYSGGALSSPVAHPQMNQDAGDRLAFSLYNLYGDANMLLHYQ